MHIEELESFELELASPTQTDSDWAGKHFKEAVSTTGYVFLLGGHITWSSPSQTASRCHTQEEHVAASSCARESGWIQRLLVEFQTRLSQSKFNGYCQYSKNFCNASKFAKMTLITATPVFNQTCELSAYQN